MSLNEYYNLHLNKISLAIAHGTGESVESARIRLEKEIKKHIINQWTIDWDSIINRLISEWQFGSKFRNNHE